MIALGVILLGALVVGIFFGIQGGPEAQRQAEAEAAAEAAVRELPVVDARDIERRLREAEAAAELERRRADAAERRAALAQADVGAQANVDARRDDLPELDPELLEALERADAIVGQRPAITAGTGQVVNEPAGAVGVFGAAPGAVPAAPPAAMFESYQDRETETAPAEAADAPFETLTPRQAPSDRIIAQGSMLRGILLTRIDTRNPGEIVAQVTADHYDTATASMLLIPRGSRLIGTYETDVVPGNPRIRVAFRRLMFPDGRAIELPDMLAVSNDGVTGVEGRYRSNLLRAIGPSIMVTLIGAWADEETRPEAPQAVMTPGGIAQSPSVVQQVVPQINEAVLRRFEGAAPFFVAEPGTALKVLVSADIEIPQLSGGRS